MVWLYRCFPGKIVPTKPADPGIHKDKLPAGWAFPPTLSHCYFGLVFLCHQGARQSHNKKDCAEHPPGCEIISLTMGDGAGYGSNN